eukprot:gene11920-biopygen7247
MPVQSLTRFDKAKERRRWAMPKLATTHWLERLVVFGGGLLLTMYGAYQMYLVVDVGGVSLLKWLLLILFVANFSWIALAFTSAIVGFIWLLFFQPKPEPLAKKLDKKTAIVMPIYNEAPSRVFGAVQAIAEDVAKSGLGDHFDYFFLSDTTNPDVWIAEERAFLAMRAQMGNDFRIYYRHRQKNTARKAGNIADFVTRWGGHYDHMVVLDADSLMTGHSIISLAKAMEADPDAGIIQTLPLIINRNTLFARQQQFAARIYGPVIAAGLAAWMGRDGNYWGHNAIIRTKAFADHCGLPDLKGRPPFGGHILSHDFVEAALIRRAGYAVYMLPMLGGSYEESPPSLIDLSARDRRWCQGNLQHLRVLPAKGLHLATRQHIITGIMSYLASPLWMAQLLIGLVLVLQTRYIRPEYFTSQFTLFPAWPRFDAVRSLSLFELTLAILLAPKLFGLLVGIIQKETRQAAGGWFPLPALRAAIDSGRPVLCIYILEEGQSLRPLGGAAKLWLHQSLAALNTNLNHIGSSLFYFRGTAEQVILEIAEQIPVAEVHWCRRYGQTEREIDAALKVALKTKQIAAQSYNGHLLFEPWEIQTKGPVRGYGEGRNRPDMPSTSRLSPHLRFGEISARQVFQAANVARDAGDAPAYDIDKFLSEIGWREFSYSLLYQFPQLPERNFQSRFDAFPWQEIEPASLKAWQRGRTGYPIVDAGLRELWQTGYMHNRVRMIVASFLIKHLMVPWQTGEAWFWDTLVDADIASNAASWQWVAGSGADAAPYFRIFNPILQGEKFDPHGDYVKKYVPELDDTGFIVYNELNYPNFTALMKELKVPNHESDMSFALTANNGKFEWCGQESNWWTVLNGLFAQRSNLFSLSYLKMLVEILRFQKEARADLESNKIGEMTLGMLKVSDSSGHSELFDGVIIASHAPEALAMLKDATPLERQICAMLYEVRNTFGQSHSYFAPIKLGEQTPAGIRQERDKLFFVSPFMDMNLRYKFRIGPPEDSALAFALRLEIGELIVSLPLGPSLVFRGIKPGPKATMVIKDMAFAGRMAREGEVGIAEAYLRHEWDTPDLTQFLLLFCANIESVQTILDKKPLVRFAQRLYHWFNRNSKAGSRRNIMAHYDLGNRFYSQWLDETMTYSSALFTDEAQTLADAQTHKYAALIKELDVSPNHHILEIGCGWGGFAEHAAKTTGCKITGLTISPAQFDFAKERIFKAGLNDKVDIKLQDYRDEKGIYDRIASIEMFEAVGAEYWPVYFRQLHERLKPEGKAGLQIITIQDRLWKSYTREIDFIRRYIFPGGMLPTPGILSDLATRQGLRQTNELPIRVDTLGTTQPVSTVALRSRVDSQIQEVLVADGALVHAGDILVKLDARQLVAQIHQAEAAVVKDQAQLEQAKRDVERYSALVAKQAGTQINLDTATTQVASLNAAILGDQAALDNLKVQLTYFTITAPITGRVGTIAMKAGNLARAGEAGTALATINQISPIYVSFSVRQNLLPDLRTALNQNVGNVLATPQGLSGSATGKIAFVDNAIDAATGTISVKAMFDNKDEILWPGQLCSVRINLRDQPNVVTVPRSALQSGQIGNFVFVVEDGKARLVPVSADVTIDNDTVIAAGLNGDETVITDGVTSMTSTSARGSTSITMQFDLDRNIDGAALDVQSSISSASKQLPPEITETPNFRKVNPGDAPIIFVVLSSSVMPLSTTNDYAEQVFAQQISQLPGVAQVNIFGQQKYAVRIEADPDKVHSRGLTLGEVGDAVAAANSSKPVGSSLGDKQNLTLEASGQLANAAAYRSLVVAWKNGSPIRLDEIASVQDSVENNQTAAWYKDDRSIILAIYRQSDANTVDVVDLIKAKMPAYISQLPASITANIVNDRSVSIRQSTISATIIPTLALPVSLIGTFGFMYLFNYSIDNISLLAITLSVGFVVDDAIVMLENIARHIEEGQKPFEAALDGSRQIAFTILSITLSLVAVFIPVLGMGGVVGRVLREFAVTISVAILVSGFVSLTLTPMLCARILKTIDHNAKQSLFARLSDWLVNGITDGYRWMLDIVLKARILVLLITVGTFVLTVSVYNDIPKDFFPQEDTGFIVGATEAAPDVSIEAMAALQQQAAAIVKADPAMNYFNSIIGIGGQPSRGFIFMALKDRSQRDGIDVVIARLRKAVSVVPGYRLLMSSVQNLNFTGGRPAPAKYQYTLQSADLTSLYSKSPEMEKRMAASSLMRDVNSDLRLTNPQLSLDIDREKASALGISSDQIRAALYSAYGSKQISTIYTQSAAYQVILESNRSFQNDPNALGRIYLRPKTSANAALVPLDQVATIHRSIGALLINRQSQQPSVTISFNLAPDASLGQATEAIHKIEYDVGLPATISTNFTGTAALFQDAQRGQGALLLAAVLTIYIVLGVLYESFIHPITILSGLPSAALGALLALRFYNMPLTVIAVIGILLLIGIVKKNAIMMVDFALERRRDGVDALSAIREAALVRFRPIIMTTLAALLGSLPIALSGGAGSELRRPLGIAIVGGLFVSQLLTLFITPVVYYYLDKIDTFLSGRKQTAAAATAASVTSAAE